jgi:hypothetical protein
VEPDWIPLGEALDYVTSIEESPHIAERRLREVLERDELPAKAEMIIHQRTEPTYVYDPCNPEDSCSTPPFRNELGPGWVPHHAWEHAVVNWAESSFERRSGPVYDHAALTLWAKGFISDKYKVSGVLVSRRRLEHLFRNDLLASSEDQKLEPKKRVGRRPNTGLSKSDDPIVEEMHELVINNECSSPTEAAKKIIKKYKDRVRGGGTEDSKIKRLVRRYIGRYEK